MGLDETLRVLRLTRMWTGTVSNASAEFQKVTNDVIKGSAKGGYKGQKGSGKGKGSKAYEGKGYHDTQHHKGVRRGRDHDDERDREQEDREKST